MSKMEGGTFGVPRAREYVESAFRYVGYTRQTAGYLSHSMMVIVSQFVSFLSPTVSDCLVKKAMSMTRDKQIKDGNYTRAK